MKKKKENSRTTFALRGTFATLPLRKSPSSNRWAYKISMSKHDCDKESVGYLLGTGTWLDWFPKLPRPMIAIGKKDLYSVLINGEGFTLPVDGTKDSAIGFYTTRFVAAENIREAEKVAYDRVLKEWEHKGFLELCGKKPVLSTEEVVILDEWFIFRSATGFAFYDNEESV